MRIAVLGAGLVGLASAHALTDEGHSVTVIDREGPAAGASRGNAGWLAHTDIEPIASPKMLRQVPKFLMDPLGPLSIRPSYLLPLLPWLTRLILASRPSNLERSIEALIPFQSLAMPAWNRLSHQLGMERMIHRRGGLFAFDSHDAFRAALPHFKRQQNAGIHIDYLDGPEVRQMEPGLSETVAGAAFFPDAAHVSDPHQVTLTLFEAARARNIGFLKANLKAIVASDEPTLHLEGRDPVRFDRVILSLGAWSKPFAAQVGDRVPLDTERGYNVSFPGVTRQLTRPVSFQGHGFVATPLDTGLRIGGAVELGGLSLPPNHARTEALYAKAQRFFRDLPAFEEGTVWMGHRPSIPDSLPVIGYARRSRSVIHAFGHGHYGLTQSAATGKLVADLVMGRNPPIDLSRFSPSRF
jgi:D-amino-acid dehydrogenase